MDIEVILAIIAQVVVTVGSMLIAYVKLQVALAELRVTLDMSMRETKAAVASLRGDHQGLANKVDEVRIYIASIQRQEEKKRDT